VVLFGALYTAAGARWLPQSAFVVCLLILFALVTALWMSVEDRQGRGRGGLARFGRVAFALVLVTICVPMVVLMPLFWLDSQLPVDAGVTSLLAPAMTITLISLALIVLVNGVGGALTLVRTALEHRRGHNRV
jgi:hypothetical protein